MNWDWWDEYHFAGIGVYWDFWEGGGGNFGILIQLIWAEAMICGKKLVSYADGCGYFQGGLNVKDRVKIGAPAKMK